MTEHASAYRPIRATSLNGLQREIRRLARRTLDHEFHGALRLREFRPSYWVPGRRRNGSIVGQRRVRWALGRVFLPVRDLLLSIFNVLVLFPISLLANDPHIDICTSFRRSQVTGSDHCAALAFADATRADQQKVRPPDLWLVWSRERAVLARIHDQDSRPRWETLWAASGSGLPHINDADKTITWADGSTIHIASR